MSRRLRATASGATPTPTRPPSSFSSTGTIWESLVRRNSSASRAHRLNKPIKVSVSVKRVVQWNGQCISQISRFSGFSRTAPTGVQLRVPRVHLRGVRALAFA